MNTVELKLTLNDKLIFDKNMVPTGEKWDGEHYSDIVESTIKVSELSENTRAVIQSVTDAKVIKWTWSPEWGEYLRLEDDTGIARCDIYEEIHMYPNIKKIEDYVFVQEVKDNPNCTYPEFNKWLIENHYKMSDFDMDYNEWCYTKFNVK